MMPTAGVAHTWQARSHDASRTGDRFGPTISTMGPDRTRQSVARRVEEAALEVFRRLPIVVRRLVTRLVAPTYTIGVVAVCLDAEDRVLLLRSRHQQGWGLPGGLLQRGEQPSSALLRELAEEIGVVVAPDELSRSPAAVVDPGSRQVTIVHLVALSSDAIADGVEIVEVGWFSRTEVPAGVVRGTQESLRLAGFTAP